MYECVVCDLQDVNGWCTLQEKLGKKCLLIAEKVLSQGLALKPSPRSKTSSARSEPTHEEQPDQPPELSPEGHCEPKEGEGTEDKDPGVEYLSCAGLQLLDTVWSTIQRAAALKRKSFRERKHSIQTFCGSDWLKGVS